MAKVDSLERSTAMAMRLCGEAELVPVSEEKKKRGEEGSITAASTAAEGRTGARAGERWSRRRGWLPFIGWVGGRVVWQNTPD